MDEAEVKRLRREIHRTYGSSPHKKKVWLALLEMHSGNEKIKNQGEGKAGKRSIRSGRVWAT
jgi:hypothetical protein